MADILLVLVGAILANNIVLTQSLGVTASLAASDNLLRAKAAAVLTMAVTMPSVALLWPLNHWLLQPLGLGFLRVLAYVFVIAVLATVGALLLRHHRPLWYRSIAALLPLVTANSAVLGTVLAASEQQPGFATAMAQGLGTAAGFALVLVMLAALRERLLVNDAPAPLQGAGVMLLTAALMSLAFMGLAGLG